MKQLFSNAKKILVIVGIVLLCNGCKSDNMEDINIITTNYPNEYIVEKLYGEHSTITPVYPDGVDISSYELTEKQEKDFANSGLFVYTGLIDRERELAITLLDYNENLKIIDSSYVLENDYDTEELWVDPSFMLMMSQNVRLGLEEYIENTILEDEIEKNYENLQLELSELDADIRLAIENAPYKTIVAADSSYLFLEKYGLKVYLLNDDTSQKDLSEITNLIENGDITKIFTYKDTEVSSAVQNIINTYADRVSYAYYNHLALLTEEQRQTNSDYITLMNQNLDTLNEELYHGTETT